jgi:hypothetical protein
MHASYARALLFSPMFSSQKLIAFVTFLTYVLTGNVMTAEIVFVTLSLFSPVRFAMTFCVPLGIQYGSEAVVTIRRLEVLQKDLCVIFCELVDMNCLTATVLSEAMNNVIVIHNSLVFSCVICSL